MKADPETREIDFELVAAEEVENCKHQKPTNETTIKNEANRRGKTTQP